MDCSVWGGWSVVLDMFKILTQGFEFKYTVRIVPIEDRNECMLTGSMECMGLAKLLATSPLGQSPKIDYRWSLRDEDE